MKLQLYTKLNMDVFPNKWEEPPCTLKINKNQNPIIPLNTKYAQIDGEKKSIIKKLYSKCGQKFDKDANDRICITDGTDKMCFLYGRGDTVLLKER